MVTNQWIQSPDYDSLNSKDAIKQAAENGGTVVFPSEFELQIDIDTEEQMRVYEVNLLTLQWMIGVAHTKVTKSRSAGSVNRSPNCHIVVTLDKPVTSQAERVLLQACLGSDPKRELLSYARIMERDPHPTLFIEGGTKPEKKVETMECSPHVYEWKDCGAQVCNGCGHHKGMARCHCGWSADGADGRRQLEEMGETIDEDR